MDLRKRQALQESSVRQPEAADETNLVAKEAEEPQPRSNRYFFLVAVAVALIVIVAVNFPKGLELLFGGKTLKISLFSNDIHDKQNNIGCGCQQGF